MIHQLSPSILVETPLGTGQTLFIIDYGMHQNTCWVVALVNDGSIKHFDCNDVILSTNYTYGLNLEMNKEPHENDATDPHPPDRAKRKNTATATPK